MKNCNLAVAESNNPFQSRSNQTQSCIDTRGRKQTSEASSLDSIEIRNTKSQKSKRTQFSVSKSVSISTLMNEQRRLAQTKSLRVCGTRGFNGSNGIKIEKHSDGSIRTTGVFLCKSACCVYCQNYKSKVVFDRISPVIKSVKNKIFITLTTEKDYDLGKVNKSQKKALKSTIRTMRRWLRKNYNQEFGYVRSRETTFDIDNHRGLHFHPHFHSVFLNNDNDFDFVSFESKFREVWRERTEKQGLVSSDLAQKFIKFDSDEDKISNYLAKGLSAELAAGAKKQSKKGESLFTLLAEAAQGNTKAQDLYKTYTKEFAGNKIIQTDINFKEFEKQLEHQEQAESEEETEIQRTIEFGEMSYERLFRKHKEDFEDICRFVLVEANQRTFERFLDVVSPETQSGIINDSKIDNEDNPEREQDYFDNTISELLNEFLHKSRIDLKTLSRRKIHYTRDITLVS